MIDENEIDTTELSIVIQYIRRK